MEIQKTAVAEEVGVNSKAVLDMLDAIEKSGANNHSLIIIRNGKLAVEKYTAPYSAKYAHSMFSVSKSFVALAVGFLIDEGYLTLDTPILDILPEYESYKTDKRYGRVTVRALLTMHSGKKCTFIRNMAKGDYAEIFMRAPFEKKVEFVYSNDDVYMLAKAVNKLTGLTLVDYLMPRIFEPLDIDRPFWEQTQQGIEAGATGLYLKTMDLAKVCLCYLNGGKWGDKQVIPQEWTKTAGQYHVKLPSYYLSSKDYGFYFWGDPFGGYRFDGMFGQWGIVLPKYNAVIALTDCSNYERAILEIIFKFIPEIFAESGKESGREGGAEALAARIAKEAEIKLPIKRMKETEKKINGNSYKLRNPLIPKIFELAGYPISMISGPITAAFPRKPWKNRNDFKFDFYDGYCTLTWREDTDVNTVKCGMNGGYIEDEITLAAMPFKTLSYAYWKDEKTLFVELRIIETLAYQKITFTFDKDKITAKFVSVPDFAEWAVTHMDEVAGAPEFLINLEHRVVKAVLKAADPIFKGRKNG